MKYDKEYWRRRALEAEARLEDVPQVYMSMETDTISTYREASMVPIVIPAMSRVTVEIKYRHQSYVLRSAQMMEVKRY